MVALEEAFSILSMAQSVVLGALFLLDAVVGIGGVAAPGTTKSMIHLVAVPVPGLL